MIRAAGFRRRRCRRGGEDAGCQMPECLMLSGTVQNPLGVSGGRELVPLRPLFGVLATTPPEHHWVVWSWSM
jgi:hypothetical protein